MNLNALRAEKSVAEAEHIKSMDEIKAHHEKLNSDIKNQANRGMYCFHVVTFNLTNTLDLMIRDTLVIELREQIQAHNRENEISE